MPTKLHDGKYYFSKNDGLQNQYVLYRSETPDGDAEVFLDPNKLSDDGTVALTGIYQSHDGKYTAYTISRSGSDWTEIYVMDTETGKLLDDHIEWAKFTGAAWQGDGFYYSAYEKPADGKEFSNANEYHKVFYHKLGTPQSEDKVIYENRNEPLHFHNVGITDDESVLFVMGGGAGNGNSLYIKDLTKPNSKWITVEDSQDYDISVIDSRDGKLYIFTSADAPRYRLVTADVSAPQRANWKELVPENKDAVLVNTDFAGDKMILTYDKDASHHAYVYNIDGTPVREITLPTYGTLSFSTDSKSPEAFYSFASFTTPASIYRYNVDSGESSLFRSTELQGFNPDDYITEQVFYPSSDGTKIPMFLTYRKGIERNGKKKVVMRKKFPNYLFIKMIYTKKIWFLVKNTRGIKDFCSGYDGKPLPMSDDEVKRAQLEKVTIDDLKVNVGDHINIMSGPLQGFIGEIKEIKLDIEKVILI
jgi:prolyl oligopeptidase